MNKNTQLRVRSVITTFIFVGCVVIPSYAQAFNRDAIITDDDMTDYTRMSAQQIQEFLTAQGGILKDHYTQDTSGVTRRAADIIYNTAVKYRLNPQFLLTRVQVEASLVTGHRADLLDWAMGYGVCDSCSKDHPDVIKYKGFGKQIDAAGNAFRNRYLADLEARNSTISGWGVGRTKTTLDGIAITPQNKATAVLYTYTPWVGYHGGASNVGGNSLFYDVINRFFPNRISGPTPTKYLEYPSGSLLQDTATGTVYKLEKGRIRPFTSRGALFANYDMRKIIGVDASVLNRYELGALISLPKYIYVQDPNGGVYLIDNNHKRRAIPSREIMRDLGINPEELIPISNEEKALIAEAAPLTGGMYPAGGLVQNKDTGAVMYIDTDQQLHPIWSKTIMENRFQGYSIVGEEPEFFDKHDKKAPAKLTNGTLIRHANEEKVFLIQDGKKRPVNSKEVLDKLGGYENVVVTNDRAALKVHKKGQPVKFTKTNKEASSSKKKPSETK